MLQEASTSSYRENVETLSKPYYMKRQYYPCKLQLNIKNIINIYIKTVCHGLALLKPNVLTQVCPSQNVLRISNTLRKQGQCT